MSGIGDNRDTYQALQDAFQAYAKETYGDEYVVQDFVMIGYVVSMEGDTEQAEYVMATSSCAPHIIEGLVHQTVLFDPSNSSDD
jgi:hypothetical protein